MIQQLREVLESEKNDKIALEEQVKQFKDELDTMKNDLEVSAHEKLELSAELASLQAVVAEAKAEECLNDDPFTIKFLELTVIR